MKKLHLRRPKQRKDIFSRITKKKKALRNKENKGNKGNKGGREGGENGGGGIFGRTRKW